MGNWGRMAQCKECGKLVDARWKKALCPKHSPGGEWSWVEHYGNTNWTFQRMCAAGEEKCEQADAEPNGGFWCGECYSKHLEKKV